MQRICVSDSLRLPLDVVTLASFACGVRGSGKTSSGVVIAEDLLHAGHQVIVLDPLDVWHGLRSSKDGQSPGYPITVIGGTHGDLPLSEGDGKVIADFLIDNTVPAILSMRHMLKAAQRRLVTDFAEHLFHRKGETGKNTPVLCIVDEASQFIPQRVMGDDARMVGAIQNWVRLGRASGIGALLIDQRPATVNKDVLSQVELLIAHRVTSPHDRKALGEWVDMHAEAGDAKKFWDTLATLVRGEAWFWSPEWLKIFERVKVRERRTFDSSATPKLGQKIAAPKKLAEIDLEKLRTKLAATVEKAKSDDPRELRKKIADLERQLRDKPEHRIVDKPVITDEVRAEMRQFIADLESACSIRSKMLENIERAINSFREAASRDTLESRVATLRDVIRTAMNGHRDFTYDPENFRLSLARMPHKPLIRRDSAGVDIPKGEKKILIAVAQHGSCSREQLTVLTGYKRSSRDTYLQRLREKEYVSVSGDEITPTDAGMSALGSDFEPLPTGEELREHWMRNLPEGEKKILSHLIHKYPKAVDREDISEATNYLRSSRDTYLQRLKSRRLVENVGRGEVRASEILFA